MTVLLQEPSDTQQKPNTRHEKNYSELMARAVPEISKTYSLLLLLLVICTLQEMDAKSLFVEDIIHFRNSMQASKGGRQSISPIQL